MPDMVQTVKKFNTHCIYTGGTLIYAAGRECKALKKWSMNGWRRNTSNNLQKRYKLKKTTWYVRM
jgi:hypothetical protein